MKPIEFGIYEALLDEDLRDAIAKRPELRTVFGKIDPEEQPARYAAFVDDSSHHCQKIGKETALTASTTGITQKTLKS